jgi:prepilin-type N-terminal cleavage/methylation domain-containing protein
MKINTLRSKSGFTLVEIMIVVAIIGLLAAIAIPNFVKARAASQTNACIANLKQLEGAQANYALEAKLAAAAPVALTDICGAGKFIARTPVCPGGGAPYGVTAVDAVPTCNIAGHAL